MLWIKLGDSDLFLKNMENCRCQLLKYVVLLYPWCEHVLVSSHIFSFDIIQESVSLCTIN